ncbi:Phage-related protein [Streptococcus equi subsp. equi]|nr:Phage-related protein [Streptococcus equi subsp. equi]
MKKEVKLITNDKTINLTDFENFMYLDYVENDVQINSNTTEINGVDGVLTGASTFAPFELELNFIFSGVDIKDYHLFKSKLRSIVYQREPYYVWHSDMPGKKYAVLPSATEIEDLYSRNGKVTLKFTVFKGYSESLRDTIEIELLQENVQFEQGLDLADKLKYKHFEKSFSIFNGSTDIIDPLKRHKLIIQMTIEAPNGFKIRNKTTGDTFEYKKKIKKSQSFILNGVYPYVDKKRVGIDTNYSYITLAPGLNNIVIEGDGTEKIEIDFNFNYIYR